MPFPDEDEKWKNDGDKHMKWPTREESMCGRTGVTIVPGVTEANCNHCRIAFFMLVIRI